MKTMLCPRCQKPVLNEVRVGTISVDVCPECRGAWFDTDELAVTLRAGDLPPELRGRAGIANPDQRPWQGAPCVCPRCGQVLDRYWYAAEPGRTFLVDGCVHGHGIWLDAGELEMAQELLRRFADESSAFARSGQLSRTLDRLEQKGLADRLRIEVTNMIRAWLGR